VIRFKQLTGLPDMTLQPRKRKSYLFRAVAVVLVLIVFLVQMRNRPAPPDSHSFTHQLRSGQVGRSIISRPEQNATNRQMSSIPLELEFETSAGKAEIYLLPFDSTDDGQQVAMIIKASDELEAGKPPHGFVATSTGQAGRIPLPESIWGADPNHFLVLMRTQADCALTLTVHYGLGSR